MSRYSDETIMRFADGELDEASSAAIEEAMQTDEDLVRRVEMFMTTRVQARDAFAPLIEEPVPAELRASVEAMVRTATSRDADIVDLYSRRRAPTPANDWVRLAAAACLAGVLGGAAGYFFAGTGGSPAGLTMAGLDPAALSPLLNTVVSGNEAQMANVGRFRAIATFRDQADKVCREFEVDQASGETVISVACHVDGQWVARFAVAAAGTDNGYAPASSTEALDAYLSAIDAGQPLAAADEQAALAALPVTGTE